MTDEPTETVLQFAFNQDHFSFPIAGWENMQLHEILHEVKHALKLSDSLKLQARLEPGKPFLDESLLLSNVLEMLDCSDVNYLEICIDNLSQIANVLPAVVHSAKKVRSEADWEAKRPPDGKLNFDFHSSFSREVYHWEDKYVVLPSLMLKQFQDHLKNDFMERWLNRLCGSVLGAAITIFVTLQNSGLSDVFRTALWTALFFCVFCIIAFGLIEAFGRPKDIRSLSTLIDSLLKRGDHAERSK
jgi:hypothetical protein